MIVSGNPSFDDPTKSDARILRRFESVVAKQGLKFGQTGLYPPAYFRNRTPPHFEYRIYEGKTTSSPYEAINFDFTKRKDALRIYSNIPEIKATPIINFIAKHYLHVQLREAPCHANQRTFNISAEKPTRREKASEGIIIKKLESIESKLSTNVEISQKEVVTLIRDVWQAGIPGVSTRAEAVAYIRGGVTPKDTRFYSRCADACLYVKLHHNKKKGIDARWRTLAQYAKPSDAKCRRKRRDAAPGVVPTLIGG